MSHSSSSIIASDDAEIIDVKSSKAFDKTHLLTMKVPAEYVMKARFFKTSEA